MNLMRFMSTILMVAAGAVLVLGTGTTVATATEPCGDFGECKAFIEINSTDGDIGFHFLMDGDNLNSETVPRRRNWTSSSRTAFSRCTRKT